MGEITHLSSQSTQKQNTTGELTAILEYAPEDGTVEQIRNEVRKGDESGVPVYMTLKDSAGNALPDDTEVLFRVDVPTEEQPIVVSERLRNISAWGNLTQAEQRNEENVDQTKIEMKGRVINVRHFDTLRVDILSSAQIDWANSEFYVDGKATRTVSYDGGN